MAKVSAPSIDKKYQTEDDLRTIQRAAEVQASRSRMAAVKRLNAQQQAGLKKIGVKTK
jgi:hypothetical protein